jgi:hypothetical protein
VNQGRQVNSDPNPLDYATPPQEKLRPKRIIFRALAGVLAFLVWSFVIAGFVLAGAPDDAAGTVFCGMLMVLAAVLSAYAIFGHLLH